LRFEDRSPGRGDPWVHPARTEVHANSPVTLASRSVRNRPVLGDAPLADTPTSVPGGCQVSGFYPVHPVPLAEPEPAKAPAVSARHPRRSANEPPKFRGCISNSRPASALELKRRPFRCQRASTAEAAIRARLARRSGRSRSGSGADGPKARGAGKGRRCGNHSRSRRPPWAQPDRPKAAWSSRGCLACRRRRRLDPKIWLPDANRPLGPGSPGTVCVREPVSRFAAPDGPAQTVLPRKGLQRAATVCRLNLPRLPSNIRRCRRRSRQATAPLYLTAPSGPARLFR
jgi:hypothetical protein